MVAKAKGKTFELRVVVAAQIPDDTLGCSSSRCSNCEEPTVYCQQVCANCGMVMIGPFGFPQFSEWQNMTVEERQEMVNNVVATSDKLGQLVLRSPILA